MLKLERSCGTFLLFHFKLFLYWFHKTKLKTLILCGASFGFYAYTISIDDPQSQGLKTHAINFTINERISAIIEVYNLIIINQIIYLKYLIVESYVTRHIKICSFHFRLSN